MKGGVPAARSQPQRGDIVIAPGAFRRGGFAEFLWGPSYSFGILRGTLDSSDVSAAFSPFQASTSYYQPRDFRNLGFTIEARGALTDEDGTGGGLTLFVTKSSALLYGGFMLDIIIGLEW